MHFYSNPERIGNPFAIPDAEVFQVPADRRFGDRTEHGWYFWFCTPGCLPESDEPWGPYPTQEDAIHACREMVNE